MWRLAAILLAAATAHGHTIGGTLTDSISRAPIPDVIVTLLGNQRYNATTDEAGVFHFPDVQPGKYFLNIVKAGYTLPAARSGSFLVDGDMRLPVEMDPLGRVEGRVRYPDGRPAPRAIVALTGEGHNYTAEADAGGRFLIEDVVPGSYILRATGAASDPKAEGELWAPTYFPSTVDRASAEPIPVAHGLIVTRDVRIRSVPARRVRGVVRDETGELAAGVTVRLENQTVVTGAGGAFEFVTREGEWRLMGARKDANVERRGITPVVVARHDLENVEIRLAAPFTVRLVFDGDADQPSSGRPNMPPMIMLSSVDGALPFAQAKGDSIPNLYPGRYTINVTTGFSKSYVESVKLGEMDVANRPFDLWDGSQPIRITLRKDGGSIRGTVENVSIATLLVVEAGEEVAAGRSHTYQSSNAHFDVGPLRPGDYFVMAVDRPPPLLGLTDQILKALLERAQKVHLDKGSVATLSLKVVPWP